MSAVPGAIDADRGLPLTVPLRHFLVGLGFLLAGVLAGIGPVADALPGLARLAHVHLLLVGWVCVTIMGATTQFVPVWSGVDLHSRRLANAQIVLVAGGLAGFAAALALGALAWTIPFGAAMLAGLWVFAYNVGRTLATLDALDVTERHFLVAVCSFALLAPLGVVLAVDFTAPVLAGLPVTRGNVLGAHATLAVFGAVLTTVYGALYQLGTMFTQTDLDRYDEGLQRVEAVGHPSGVALLAAGRLAEWAAVARTGGLLVLVGAACVAVVLARKLLAMRVERTPMHARYAVVSVAFLGWALASAPAWARAPTARAHLFGAPGSVHLLFLGVIGFVVLGTLYHVVPFVVWVERYSDLLGFEDVPMIDDLYDDRLAAVDGLLLVAGTALVVAAERAPEAVAVVPGGSATTATTVGGVLVTLGVVAFAANLLLVVRRHGPSSVGRVVLGALAPRRNVDGREAERRDDPSAPER